MSSLIWIQSCLLPITPIRKSSAYLMYFSRLILSSISSPAGYFSRSLTVSLILANNCLRFVSSTVFRSFSTNLALRCPSCFAIGLSLRLFPLLNFCDILLDILIEFVKVYVRQYRAYNTTLRSTTV